MTMLASMQAAAQALLSSQGQAVTLTPPSGTYSTATRTFTSNATPIQTTGVVLPLSRGLVNMPGTEIQAGDQQLLLPGTIAQPVVGTQVAINGKNYTITEVNPVSGAYFDCIIRAPQ